MGRYPLETAQHRQLREAVWATLSGWHRFLIAIDGVDAAGKSTLARYLAWQLGMPAIETDTFLAEDLRYRDAELRSVLESRLAANRPVIVEGVRILHILRTLQLECDFLIWVEQEEWSGTQRLATILAEYLQEYRPAESAHFTFRWRDELDSPS